MTASLRWLGILALLALALVAGAWRWWPAPVALAALFIVVSYIQPLWRREAFLTLLWFTAGFIYALLAFAVPPDPGLDGEKATIKGTVASYPQYFDNRVSFDFEPEEPGDEALKRLRVNIYDEITVERGAVLALTGKLVRPRAAGNPGQFDYRAYLEHQKIYYSLNVNAAAGVKVLAAGQGLAGAMSSFRSKFSAYVTAKLTEQEAAVLLGMTLGQREAIDEERYADFQNTGVVHLFSVSGLHVGFLMLLTGWLTSWRRLPPVARLALSLAVLLLYASLVGWPVPVTRASIMTALLLVAYYTGRPGQSLNALSLAGVIILLLDPHALFTVSFQLSFAAAYGLVGLFPLLRGALNRQSWWRDALLVPLCAQLATLPLIIYYFHICSLVSLPANLLVTWLAAGVVICGFLTAMVFSFSSLLAAFFIYPAGMLVEVIMRVIALLARLPGAYLTAAAVGPLSIAAYYAGLIILGLRCQRRIQERRRAAIREEYDGDGATEEPIAPWWRRYSAAAALLLMALLLAQAFYPAGWRHRGELEVVFIDVGQGDAILLKSPGGKHILLDGGGSQVYDVGERVVLPYLYQRGVRELDMMISSHPDFDHTDGLASVARALPVAMAGLRAGSVDAEEYEPLLEALRARGSQIVTLQQGDEWQIEPGVTLEVLHPPADAAYRRGDDNNASLVLALRWQDFSLLLTGDAEQKAQQLIMDAGGPGCFAAVKVPHHGSRNALTEDFYAAARPQVAVISVGANNSYGHPHAAVLAALEAQGIRIWRTDLDGAVTLLTNGAWLEVEGYRDREE